MARKKQPQPSDSVAEPTAEGHAALVAEIAALDGPPQGHNGGPPLDPDSELAIITGGMDVDAFVDAIYEGVHDVLGECDIYMAARVLDQSVAELLMVMKDSEGVRASQMAAIKFAETILPYAQEPAVSVTPYKRLRKPSTISEEYKALVDELEAHMEAGDDLARRCLAAMSLLIAGWRYGDPDPVDPGPDDGGGAILDIEAFRLAA